MIYRAWAWLLILTCVGGTAAAEWPAFRGPQLDGYTPEKNLPIEWGKDNIRWKVSLPQEGNSSPVVWGDRVFVTLPLDKKGHRRALWCLSRADGKKLWEQVVEYPESEPTHGTNPVASATPVTDGQRVIVSYGSAGLYCYDVAGKEQWRYDLGKLHHIWGNASSPILYDNLVILWAGPGERQFLLALDKATGKEVWQHDEPGGKFGSKGDGWIGSWSTPVIAHINGRDELILPVPEKVKGFDPKTGKELWSCDGLGKLIYSSPAVSKDGIVTVFSGYGGPSLAVRAGGSGDVTKTHRLWQHKTGNPQCIGSPVIVGDHCYLVREPGQAQCFELKTGKDVWGKQRLATTWSSLTVTADGKLFLPTMDGSVYVLAASPDFQQLARNELGKGERTRSSLAVSDGDIFHRTFRHLYRVSGAKK